MAITGDSYKYDVFFSYAWGTATGDDALRDWSRMVADKIAKLLRLRFSSRLSCFLDRDANKHTAKQLDAEFKAATQNCAVFVALISPYYQESYGFKELEWFLERQKADGTCLADRMCIFLAQETGDELWPAPLRESTGNRLLYRKFHCDEGQPLEIAAFLNDAPTPALSQPTFDASLEIGYKLNGVRDKTGSRTTYRQRRADAPIMFLEAEPKDADLWARRRSELKQAAKVLPAREPRPATDIGDPDDAYGGCDALVLLRSRSDDEIGRRLKRAYLDKRQIENKHKKDVLPWALLDEQDEPPPEMEVFDIPRVVPQGDWVAALQRTLRDT